MEIPFEEFVKYIKIRDKKTGKEITYKLYKRDWELLRKFNELRDLPPMAILKHRS